MFEWINAMFSTPQDVQVSLGLIFPFFFCWFSDFSANNTFQRPYF